MFLLIFENCSETFVIIAQNKVEEKTGDEQFSLMHFYPGSGVYQFTSM